MDLEDERLDLCEKEWTLNAKEWALVKIMKVNIGEISTKEKIYAELFPGKLFCSYFETLSPSTSKISFCLSFDMERCNKTQGQLQFQQILPVYFSCQDSNLTRKADNDRYE